MAGAGDRLAPVSKTDNTTTKEKKMYTECCDAEVTFHDTTLCCKSCWQEVSLEYLLDDLEEV
jgi:hypothetical protein